MRRRKRVALRSEGEFEAYSARYPAPTPAANAEAIAETIARKHCAGRRGSVNGAEVLAALADAADTTDDTSRAISWMLGSIRGNECALLVTRCGVRPADLARHVRSRATHPSAVVRFLNQFAIRSS